MSSPSTSPGTQFTDFPVAPDLVLRVGFAGKRDLTSAQSETTRNRRLAEIKRLHSRIQSAKAYPNTNRGSWTLKSLHLSEKVANSFVQEGAEWSVLYAKELVEL